MQSTRRTGQVPHLGDVIPREAVLQLRAHYPPNVLPPCARPGGAPRPATRAPRYVRRTRGEGRELAQQQVQAPILITCSYHEAVGELMNDSTEQVEGAWCASEAQIRPHNLLCVHKLSAQMLGVYHSTTHSQASNNIPADEQRSQRAEGFCSSERCDNLQQDCDSSGTCVCC